MSLEHLLVSSNKEGVKTNRTGYLSGSKWSDHNLLAVHRENSAFQWRDEGESTLNLLVNLIVCRSGYHRPSTSSWDTIWAGLPKMVSLTLIEHLDPTCSFQHLCGGQQLGN